MSKLKRLSDIVKAIAKSDISGNMVKSASAGLKNYTNKIVNARGRGIRFARINGRIVPIRPKK
jgi:hypothetical protein